ncbi:MAG: DUF2842 domain-containing protein [Pseudomonadota bacterium]
MRRSMRTLVAVFAVIFGLAIYAMAVMALWAAIQPLSLWVAVLYHIVFGFIWLLPCKWLLSWIGAAPDAAS